MTKREVVWLLIRLAGVFFAYLAIITLFTVITSGWSTIFAPPKLDVPGANSSRAPTMPGIQPVTPYDPAMNPSIDPSINPANPNQIGQPTPVSATPEKPEDKLRREAVMKVLGSLLLALIYGGLGFYFLRDGRILYILLMREDSDKAKNSEPEVTTLNL